LVEEAMNLAWHGARAEKPGLNVTLEQAFDAAAGDAALFPQEFTRVLLNLVGNAVYATAQRGLRGEPGYEPTVRVGTRALGDSVEVTVRDNGTGIPEAMRKRIFEPFFTTKPAGEGTGLGLSLSHDIVVKQHGGSFTVESQEGAFTEFRVLVPRVAREAREEA
jgi:signal transduction histidine kinase